MTLAARTGMIIKSGGHMEKLAKATGANVVSKVSELTKEDLPAVPAPQRSNTCANNLIAASSGTLHRSRANRCTCCNNAIGRAIFASWKIAWRVT